MKPLPEEAAIKRPGIADYASIARPEICAAVAASVYAAFSIYGPYMPSTPAFAALSSFLACAGAMSFSGYLAPDAPYKRTSILMTLMFSLAGMLLSFSVSADAPPLVAAAAIFSALYFWKLKRIVLLGNIAFAALAAIPFASVLLSSAAPPVAAFLPACVFLVAAGTDVYRGVNSMMDGEASASLAEKYGVNRARTVAAAFLLLAIAVSFAPFGTGLQGYVYMLFALLADMMLLAAIYFHKNTPAISAFSIVLMIAAFATGSAA